VLGLLKKRRFTPPTPPAGGTIIRLPSLESLPRFGGGWGVGYKAGKFTPQPPKWGFINISKSISPRQLAGI